MKKHIHKTIGALLLAGTVFSSSCTKDFVELNTNPAGVTDEEAMGDFALVASFLAQAQRAIIPENVGEYQVAVNLSSDAYGGYLAAQNPFVGNANNLTYALVPGWYSSLWVDRYIRGMNPVYRAEILTRTDQELQDIFAFSKILKVSAMHRTADKVGPIIYSKYNTPDASDQIGYDTQEDAYKQFFKDLDSATTILSSLKGKPVSAAMLKSDLAYTTDNYNHWLKFANTLRLRLALRIAYKDAALAKTEGEKALNPSSGGLMETNADNCFIALSTDHPLNIIATTWSDTRMSAEMESFLLGYEDPRLAKLFAPATDAAVKGKFKGIRAGIDIDAKSRYDNYSKPLPMQNKMQLMIAAEAWFLKAEAALRGWSNAGNAKANYESGIESSFGMFGLQAGSYKTNATKKAIPYLDPKSTKAGANDVLANSPYLSTVTIAWNEADSKDRKLERIITQKWIAMFPDGDEAWAEYRRSGYPILFPVVVNYSGGTIPTNPGIRRMPYPEREYNSNSQAVNEAVKMLGGPDNGGTRLWWDVENKKL
ncbi:SusD/RagB family nutrient-binding outer membrane lipoprotein [Sphingobacterium sp. DK4209]|uniref:SusD/RagB family nutrient-binding outer membrane lipoprotein n=1 Tax=Sphingobacterium zhuxiongii TaxID=2662364 RepID=A0A5Q0QBX2_9SPHI|nr:MULTISPECIES: SusD/RagB family nutrient-binding outer membrane lipoprotein [unclassified Sphingobacterium]MVZ64730.1 SusD/RagB family nutrient-binding outer membrane lipoprotein [Sphingobacterium sp. DK4209]QGA27063.1 SusD/RagB family nutrient-binding outer membrane lipoprotein [Sphingobacterium sp. dk4302]